MAVIENVEGVKKAIERMIPAYVGSGAAAVSGNSVVVGYTAGYAVYVHENLYANHPVGEAKFLERPARELGNDGTFRRILTEAMKQHKNTLIQALMLCGLRLQRDSQERVPIDTGYLRGSAFTKAEQT